MSFFGFSRLFSYGKPGVRLACAGAIWAALAAVTSSGSAVRAATLTAVNLHCDLVTSTTTAVSTSCVDSTGSTRSGFADFGRVGGYVDTTGGINVSFQDQLTFVGPAALEGLTLQGVAHWSVDGAVGTISPSGRPPFNRIEADLDFVGPQDDDTDALFVTAWPEGPFSYQGATFFEFEVGDVLQMGFALALTTERYPLDFLNTGQIDFFALPEGVSIVAQSGTAYSVQSAAVPEPGAVEMTLLGLLGLFAVRRRRGSAGEASARKGRL